MAVTVRKRWLGIAATIISLISSWLTSYIQSSPSLNPVAVVKPVVVE